MKKLLHIVKDADNIHVRNVIRRQSETPDVEVTVVLVQDAAKARPNWKAKIYAQEEDAKKVGSGPAETISTARMLDLIFDADSVTVW